MVLWVVMQADITARCPLPEKGISHHQKRLPFQKAIKSLTTHGVSPKWMDYFFFTLWVTIA